MCFLLLASLSVDAQIIRRVGVDLGYSHAKQIWDYAANTGITAPDIEPITGISVGVFIELFDIPYFSVMAKCQYLAKGRIISVMETALDPNSHLGYVDLGIKKNAQRLDYLSVPLLAKCRIETPQLAPYVAIGPCFEYLLNYPPTHVFSAFRKVEWTATIAMGCEISIASLPRLLVEADYNTSLTDPFKNEYVTVSDNSFEILLGIVL